MRNTSEKHVVERRINNSAIHYRLDYQPLFGKGARAPPPNSLLGEGRPDTRERRKSSLAVFAELRMLLWIFEETLFNGHEE